MAFGCFPNPSSPGTWGFAHICAGCGDHGPVVGNFPVMRDEAEMQRLGIVCGGPASGCLAHSAGWLTGGERDLCPKCRPT